MTEALSFRAFGFRINVQMSFFVLLGIYLLFDLQAQQPIYAMISWALVVFFSIVWHELGHAVTARYLRVPVGDIELHGLGGHVTTARTDARRQLMISLAGPFAGLFLGGIGIAIANAFGMDPFRLMFARAPSLSEVGSFEIVLWVILAQALFVNIVWSVINLFPIRPLDGGNALLAFLQLNLRDSRRAFAITSGVGMAVGGAAAVWGYLNGQIFIALLGAYLTYQNYQVYQQVR